MPAPDQHFIEAVRAGFQKARARTRKVTPDLIWDEMAYVTKREPGGFRALFLWDDRKGHYNPMTIIYNVISLGYVPGIEIARYSTGEAKLDRGRAIIVETPPMAAVVRASTLEPAPQDDMGNWLWSKKVGE